MSVIKDSLFLFQKLTVHVWAMVAPILKRSDMDGGRDVGILDPGWIASIHFEAASTTSSGENCFKDSISSSISLKQIIVVTVSDAQSLPKATWFHHGLYNKELAEVR